MKKSMKIYEVLQQIFGVQRNPRRQNNLPERRTMHRAAKSYFYLFFDNINDRRAWGELEIKYHDENIPRHDRRFSLKVPIA